MRGSDRRSFSPIYIPITRARVPDRPSADLGHNAAPFRFHELFHPCPVRHPSRAHAPRPTVIAKESPPIDREGERLMIGNRKMGNRGRQVSHDLMRIDMMNRVVRMPRDQVGTVGTSVYANANAKERVKEKDTATSNQQHVGRSKLKYYMYVKL